MCHMFIISKYMTWTEYAKNIRFAVNHAYFQYHSHKNCFDLGSMIVVSIHNLGSEGNTRIIGR